MRYIEASVGSAYIPKLLGIYERELAGVIESACCKHLARIVILGAGEGYYAIGFALRNPHASVIAYEKTSFGQTAIGRLAELNGVQDRVAIKGLCKPEQLRLAISSSAHNLAASSQALVICDVEGDEWSLLDPGSVPGLKSAFILAELHEFICPGITGELRERFGRTHQICEISQEDRAIEDFPFQSIGTRLLPPRYLAWAVSEWRPQRMSWLWMTPIE